MFWLESNSSCKKEGTNLAGPQPNTNQQSGKSCRLYGQVASWNTHRNIDVKTF